MRILTTIFILLMTSSLWAQQFGSIEGKVVDAENKMELIGATIALYQNGVLKKGASVDFFGKYSIKPLDPGTYDVEIRYLGYKPQRRAGITVTANQTTVVNFALKAAVAIAGGKDTVVEVTYYKEKLIDPTSTQEVMTSEEITALPTQETNDMVSLTGKMFQKDDGEGVNASGARSNSNVTFIDGVKVIGDANIPKDAINQIAVINGGVPAMYGDATGAIVNITTKGISYKPYGGIEVQSSQYLDPFGRSIASGFLGGPMIWKKKTKPNPIGEGNIRTADGNEDSLFRVRPVVGYMFSGQATYQLDSDPSAIGNWRVRESIVDSLSQVPYKPASLGTGVERKSFYLTSEDMEHIKVKPNNDRLEVTLSGKLDFALTKDVNLTFGGSGNYYSDNVYSIRNMMVNSRNNAYRDRFSYRTFGRFSQTLFSDIDVEEMKDQSFWLSNAFYSLQLDYSYDKFQYYNKEHQFNMFNYNYLGKFETKKAPIFVLGEDSLTGKNAWLLQGYQDTSYTYTRSEINPILANYTTSYYDLMNDNQPESFTDLLMDGAFINGGSMGNLYSLYNEVGSQVQYFTFTEDEQFRLTLSGNIDLNFRGKGSRKDSVYTHALTLGLEYEQRIGRTYQANPWRDMWSTMRQLANRHISGLDLDNPINVAGPNYDTIYYNRKYVADDQSVFDKNLREALGLNPTGTDFIDIDNLDPSTFSLDMFSPDELLNNGNEFIFYSGYDHTGKKLTTNPGFFDFFTQKDADGNYVRPIPANAPVYSAAYIQDNFRINDLLLNMGLRVDRYDANSMVLRDPYSLYAIKSASDVTTLNGVSYEHPTNIGNGYAVYVDDMDNPSAIAGYRNGDVWYDENGVVVSNPELIAQSSNTGYITPYLVNPDDDIKSEDFDPTTAFRDYTPSVTVMPRVQFRFRLKEDALFFAHYDVLAERPKGNASGGLMGPANAVSAYEYYYLQEIATDGYLPNPNLKPQKTIDYSVGFMQALKKDVSAITVSGFYREFRDMLQVTTLSYAYPVTYRSYANIDFGTVKGFTLAFDLRKTSTSNITLQADYTMQFASGTGSDLNSQVNLVGADQPNLRAIVPLTFDQRHTLTAQMGYGFEGGSRYNGPDIKLKKVNKATGDTTYSYLLENFNISTVFRMGSGTPFTKQTDPTPSAMFGVAQRSNLDGSINGSYSPYTFKVDLQVNKSFSMKLGNKPKDDMAKDNRKTIFLKAFLRVQNLLNTQNIMGVYSYTGTPDDDGYLSSAVGQELIEDQLNPDSFYDMYMVKVNNPGRYSLPRRISLGLSMNF